MTVTAVRKDPVALTMTLTAVMMVSLYPRGVSMMSSRPARDLSSDLSQ